MDLKGEYLIPTAKNIVWNHLNDPQTLKKSIKGCESLDKISDTEFNAKVKAKIGPVSASFNGSVILSDLNPPNSYVITGQGKGGAAGFAKGNVKISLIDGEETNSTILKYEGNAQVGGKLAQLGSRLIGGIIKNTADDFFKTFNNSLVISKTPESISENPVKNENISKNISIPYWIWISSLIIIIGIILAFFT